MLFCITSPFILLFLRILGVKGVIILLIKSLLRLAQNVAKTVNVKHFYSLVHPK